MRLTRLGPILLYAAALAACTNIGGGSRAVNVGPGSNAAIDPTPPAGAPPVCKPGEQLLVLGGIPRCV